ncbi:MAG: SDR family NAD(P)-dependent oxidoreductase [Pseudomonadota bacterium]
MTLKETQVGTSVVPRVMGCVLNQRRKALICPDIGRRDDLVIAITGATNGIGLETARELARAGAQVLFLVRNEAKARELLLDWQNPGNVSVVSVDLGDLTTVAPAIEAIKSVLKGRRIDTLIENAGVSPRKYEQTAQGYELAFGTNVLGHFALRKMLIDEAILTPSARIVVLTGDIYITASDCTHDFTYKTLIGGSKAYSRSKLGNIWIARVLQHKYPELTVALVHPGVVASGLMMGDKPWERLMKKPLLPTRMGAQTSLYCATQPIVKGGYYHNTRGRVHLAANDPAMDGGKAQALWSICEKLAAPFLSVASAEVA